MWSQKNYYFFVMRYFFNLELSFLQMIFSFQHHWGVVILQLNRPMYQTSKWSILSNSTSITIPHSNQHSLRLVFYHADLLEINTFRSIISCILFQKTYFKQNIYHNFQLYTSKIMKSLSQKILTPQRHSKLFIYCLMSVSNVCLKRWNYAKKWFLTKIKSLVNNWWLL